jgi:hypothetical protein
MRSRGRAKPDAAAGIDSALPPAKDNHPIERFDKEPRVPWQRQNPECDSSDTPIKKCRGNRTLPATHPFDISLISSNNLCRNAISREDNRDPSSSHPNCFHKNTLPAEAKPRENKPSDSQASSA